MKSSDILTLLHAGYTKDEIQNMDFSPAEPMPVPAPAPAPVPAPTAAPAPGPVEDPGEHAAEEPVPAPVPVPVPAPTPAPAQPTMAELMQSIAKLTSAVQANAIAQSVIPAGAYNPPSAEDMLAEIIRPTFKEVK